MARSAMSSAACRSASGAAAAREGSPAPATGTARYPCHRPARVPRTPATSASRSRPARRIRCGRSACRRPGTGACWPGSAACPVTPAGCAAARHRNVADATASGTGASSEACTGSLRMSTRPSRGHPADAPAVCVLGREAHERVAARPGHQRGDGRVLARDDTQQSAHARTIRTIGRSSMRGAVAGPAHADAVSRRRWRPSPAGTPAAPQVVHAADPSRVAGRRTGRPAWPRAACRHRCRIQARRRGR